MGVYCFDAFWIDISGCLFLLVAGSLLFLLGRLYDFISTFGVE